MVIHLLIRAGPNVEPLGSRPAEGGARVLPVKLPLVAAVTAGAGAMVGSAGTDELGPTVPTMGRTPIVGTAGAELTPRLPISVESIGIPGRGRPPGVMGNVDAVVGVDDEAMLLEPEPHIPDIPEVSSIPEDVDIPDETDISDDVDVPGIAVGSVVAAVGSIVAMLPAAVAGVAMPGAVPPPSKLAVDPNIPDGDSPPVEHVVPLAVIAPLVGIPIVPVTLPVGAGLTPSELISVESMGIPAGPTDPPALIPRGEVVPSEGTAVRGSSTSTWANAGPAHNRDPAASAINNDLMRDTAISAIGFAAISPGAMLSDIGRFPGHFGVNVGASSGSACETYPRGQSIWQSQRPQMPNFVFSAVAPLETRMTSIAAVRTRARIKLLRGIQAKIVVSICWAGSRRLRTVLTVIVVGLSHLLN
jgi:hypothetical protein